jgi:hypothetical protein
MRRVPRLGIFRLVEIDGPVPADCVGPLKNVFDRGSVDLPDIAQIGRGARFAKQRPHFRDVSRGAGEVAPSVVRRPRVRLGRLGLYTCRWAFAGPPAPTRELLDRLREPDALGMLHKSDDVAAGVAIAAVKDLLFRVDGEAVAPAA